jgi:hypothetical protein
MKRIVALLVLMLPGVAMAQSSSSYDLSEHVLNNGGTPHAGTVLSSASYQLTLGSIGDGLVGNSPRLGGGFVGSYPPPGEVLNARFSDATTLLWDAESSVGHYNLYQGTISHPPDPAYGSCLSSPIAAETAPVTTVPPLGEALFFLLTAENRLREEGIKGRDSLLTVRPNPAPCP